MESDVVVIAFPTAHNSRQNLDVDFIDRTVQGFLTTVETKFEVVAVLKGKPVSDQLGVLHCERKENARFPDNGPNLPRFTSKIVLPRLANKLSLQKSTFMLFLTRNDDGTLEFVTGRYDSVFSVKQLLDVDPGIPRFELPQPK